MKVLVILSRFPYPLEKGDKLRAFQHIQMLASEHEVYLAAISDSAVSESQLQHLRPYCKEVLIVRHTFPEIILNLINAFFRKLPLQVAYFYSPKARKAIRQFHQSVKADIVYCQLIRTALYGKDLDASVKVIDFQDAFSAGTAQRLAKAPFWMRPIFSREVRLVNDFEKESFSWFDKHLVISEADRNQLQVVNPDNIRILVNGIDVDRFYAPETAKTIDLLFVGNMQYPPNVDAAVFLVNQIMPLIWKELPGLKLVLCGADPVKEVKALAGNRVEVTGWVEDVKKYYQSARVFIAPMRIGTGLQNKLLEAMACGVPCVTTHLSALPLGGKEGVDILVGDTPTQLANCVISLYSNDTMGREISENGNKLVRSAFSFHSVTSQLLSFLKK